MLRRLVGNSLMGLGVFLLAFALTPMPVVNAQVSNCPSGTGGLGGTGGYPACVPDTGDPPVGCMDDHQCGMGPQCRCRAPGGVCSCSNG
jgi:hypothetical protein